ncbi:hypothetical protein TcCL_NonESM01190 [Trypanosoma cruzi]|nr:hypothetical protein TcCL_NonESM01190 [Trypanosoma cruzi]
MMERTRSSPCTSPLPTKPRKQQICECFFEVCRLFSAHGGFLRNARQSLNTRPPPSQLQDPTEGWRFSRSNRSKGAQHTKGMSTKKGTRKHTHTHKKKNLGAQRACQINLVKKKGKEAVPATKREYQRGRRAAVKCGQKKPKWHINCGK